MLRCGAGLANPLLLGGLRLAELAGCELAESVVAGFVVTGLVGCEPGAGEVVGSAPAGRKCSVGECSVGECPVAECSVMLHAYRQACGLVHTGRFKPITKPPHRLNITARRHLFAFGA